MFQIKIKPSTSESCTDFLLSSSRTPRTVKENTLQVANATEYNNYKGAHEIKFLYNQNTPTKELMHPKLDSFYLMRFHYLDALLGVNGSHIVHSKALEFNQYTCRAKKWREEEGGYSSRPQRSPCFITDNKEAKITTFQRATSEVPGALTSQNAPLQNTGEIAAVTETDICLHKAMAGLYPATTQCSLFTPKMKRQ